MSRTSPLGVPQIWLEQLHPGQMLAYQTFRGRRFMALRCGRRFGKTEFAKNFIAHGILAAEEVAWFAPQHMAWSEVYADLRRMLAPLVATSSKSQGVIRFTNQARIDFWSMENPNAGRGRRYHRIVIDEAAFAKDGDNRSDSSAMAIWELGIKPTLVDFEGRALICSNSAGKNVDNFFYNICEEPQYGFTQFHAPTIGNPLLPKRTEGEPVEAWRERRTEFFAALKNDNDPLVYAQEYCAEFVDWSGAAFFSREKLLVEGRPLPIPVGCDTVFAVIDTASKTGTDNDATAVTYFALDPYSKTPLFILDWDVVQIEGALLVIWLPQVFERLEELARLCRARGSTGAWIEDKNSGTILLQQARLRQMPAQAIKSKLTSLGKDPRAISVSGHVYNGSVKYTDRAFHKTTLYKGHSRNHLLDQVENFRIGDKKSNREDDLLDTFCYGIALALGNSEGF